MKKKTLATKIGAALMSAVLAVSMAACGRRAEHYIFLLFIYVFIFVFIFCRSHPCTSSSVIACIGQRSTHIGFAVPSVLLCTHILHFIISIFDRLSYFSTP